MKSALAIALATCLPTALPAGQVFGLWCNEHGDQMQIDAIGMRGGEHLTCDWRSPVADGAEIRADLHCKTLKLLGGQWVPIHEETYDFIAELADADHLRVAYTDGRFNHTLTRCEVN
ncbi:hypothetical protein [uncultured Shimia sp.]|uniref:hypothetical protein n=1 Tax=uncultured Shimia sp. TaxID=573152 RepID=UPI0026123E97|nr:hypothetical protein [uncultured Shimia sp.]